MRFTTNGDKEVFDVLIEYAGGDELLSAVLSKPGRREVEFDQVIRELDALRAIQGDAPSGGQPPGTPLQVQHSA